MSRKKQGFVYGALILMLSNVVVKIVGALFKIPLKNVIGSTAMGYFGTAYSVYSMFFLISTAGLPVAISRMIAAAKARNKDREVEKIYRTSLIIFMIMIILTKSGSDGSVLPESVPAWAFLPACIVLYLVSMYISMRVYEKKELTR